MIGASNVRSILAKRADDLHMKLCAKIEQAIVNAAMASFNELLVQLHTAMQLAPREYPPLIRLEATLMILNVCNLFWKLLVMKLKKRPTQTVLLLNGKGDTT